MAFEDIEWFQRALLAGMAGACRPELAIRHAHGRRGDAVAALMAQNDVARGAY